MLALPAARRFEAEVGRNPMTRFDLHRRTRIALASIAILTMSGCAMIDTNGAPPIPVAGNGQAASAAGQAITMEIRESGKKPEIKQFPLEQSSTVQQLLEQTRLVKKFRRMDIEVMRTAGDQRAKMTVKYDHTQGMVRPEYDYALHPGDHVIVQEVTKTAFDDMLESVADPLRRATGGR